MLRLPCRRAWFLGIGILIAGNSWAADSLTEVLPPGAVVSVELVGGEAVVEQLRNSEFVRALAASDLYATWSGSEPGRRFHAGKAILEAQLGMDLWDATRRFLGDRVAAAVYLPEEQGAPPNGILVVRFADEATGTLLREKLSPWIDLSAGAVTAEERNGIWIVSTKDGNLTGALRGSWLVLSNQVSLREGVLSRISGDGLPSLATSSGWQPLLAAPTPGEGTRINGVWDSAPIRERLGAPRLLPSEVDHPAASLLLGGLMEVAAISTVVRASLDIDPKGFRSTFSAPIAAGEIDAPHRTLLASAQQASDLAPAVPRQLAGITLCRRWAEWYRSREELIEDQTLPEFDKFETGLSTFLPGKDFCEDVLSLLNPPLSFVFAEQTYPHLEGRPGMALPAFAVVLDLTDAPRGSDLFQLFFQTVGTIANIEAGKQGRQPWVLTSESYHDIQITYAKYLDVPQGTDLPVVYNFQPASAVVGNKYVAATSRELCRDLIDAIRQGKTATPADANLRNMEFRLDPSVGANLLDVNRPVITSKRVQAGRSLEQANQELDLLLDVLRRLTPIALCTNVSPEGVELRLEGGWK